MKTVIFSALFLVGFSFSAEGQLEMALELCKDCESHLTQYQDDNRISCVEKGGHPMVMIGTVNSSELKLDEVPSIGAMQKELRSVSNKYFKVDLSSIEVLRIENNKWANAYLVHCRHKGLTGVIGVNLYEPQERDPWKKEPPVHELKFWISNCEDAALDQVVDKEDGFECIDGPMRVEVVEVKTPFKFSEDFNLSLSKAQYIIDNTPSLKGEIYKLTSKSSRAHKFYTKFEGEKYFYLIYISGT